MARLSSALLVAALAGACSKLMPQLFDLHDKKKMEESELTCAKDSSEVYILVYTVVKSLKESEITSKAGSCLHIGMK
jgi:hypothetical protein